MRRETGPQGARWLRATVAPSGLRRTRSSRCRTGDIVFVSILLLDERRTVRAIDRRPVTPIARVPFDRGSQLCICVGKAGRHDVNEDAPSAVLGSDEVGFATVVRASVEVTP